MMHAQKIDSLNTVVFAVQVNTWQWFSLLNVKSLFCAKPGFFELPVP